MDIGPPLIDLYAWLATLEDATYASFSPGGPARVGSRTSPRNAGSPSCTLRTPELILFAV
jgi:hypothetical protein